MAPDVPAKGGLLGRIGSSRFRYLGRTQYQSRMASNMIDRQPPKFQRSMSGRLTTRSLDGSESLFKLILNSLT